MTEQEAKTKWCPMVRHVGPKAPLDSTPQAAVHNNSAHCKGSQCMMWRWNGWADRGRVEDCHGHCGLAGDVGGTPK